MKGIFKVLSVLLLSFGFILTAKAQDENINAPAQDEIVCTQVAENVFDCYVVPGGTDQFEGEDPYLGPEYGQEDLNREEMDRENQDELFDPERNEDPEQMDTEEEFWTEPETPSNPSNPADPYYQEMNLPIQI